MSYVAERRGGGPQHLPGGFDSFRNCKQKKPKRGFHYFGRIDYHRGANNPFTLSGIRSTSTHSPLPRSTGIRSPLPRRSTGIGSTTARFATTQGIRSGCITRTSARPLTNNRPCKALSPISNPCPRTHQGPTTRRKRKSILIYIFSTPMQGPAQLHKIISSFYTH